jgi:hypothetical protein
MSRDPLTSCRKYFYDASNFGTMNTISANLVRLFTQTSMKTKARLWLIALTILLLLIGGRLWLFRRAARPASTTALLSEQRAIASLIDVSRPEGPTLVTISILDVRLPVSGLPVYEAFPKAFEVLSWTTCPIDERIPACRFPAAGVGPAVSLHASTHG